MTVLVIARKEDNGDWIFTTFLFVLVTLVISFIITGFVISEKASLKEARRNVTIAEKRLQAVEQIINKKLEKYPMEKNLLNKFNPAILLRLPEIKSDSLLKETIKQMAECQQQIYHWELRISSLKQALDFHKSRWFSPTWASPKYECTEEEKEK